MLTKEKPSSKTAKIKRLPKVAPKARPKLGSKTVKKTMGPNRDIRWEEFTNAEAVVYELVETEIFEEPVLSDEELAKFAGT